MFCVSDGSGALFLRGFFAYKKKRERTARPEAFLRRGTPTRALIN